MPLVTERHLNKLISDRYKAELEYLDSVNGGQLICNFKQYRLRAGLSLLELSRQSHISKNGLVRAEQGTYANPMPALLNYWLRTNPNLTYLEVEDGYIDYQQSQRLRNFKFFGKSLIESTVSGVNDPHPFRQLRHRHVSPYDGEVLPVGVDQVSRALCLPVDTLRYWEQKWRLQKSVPKLVREGLLTIGYGRSEVSEFCDIYSEWRQVQPRKGLFK